MSQKKTQKKRVDFYKPEYCEMLKEHLKAGLSYEAFAGLIGVHRDTLYNWELLHPAFSDTKKKYWEAGRHFWESLGRAGAMGKVPGFNSTAWIFTMKNRFKWKDRQEIEHTGEGGGPIKYQNLSEEQIKDKLTKVLALLADE